MIFNIFVKVHEFIRISSVSCSQSVILVRECERRRVGTRRVWARAANGRRRRRRGPVRSAWTCVRAGYCYLSGTNENHLHYHSTHSLLTKLHCFVNTIVIIIWFVLHNRFLCRFQYFSSVVKNGLNIPKESGLNPAIDGDIFHPLHRRASMISRNLAKKLVIR